MKISRKDDFLKYWRVIRFYVKRKYKINTEELDVLLFLYSEEYFNKDKFDKLNGELMPTSKMRNPLFLARASYSDKVYRNMIIQMNEAIKQEQCHSLEL
jgi:hypothetical protein